jgi:hypothetical protein
MRKLEFDPLGHQTERVNDTYRQTSSRMDMDLDVRADNSTPSTYPVKVNEQMISDFEEFTGLFGIGQKILGAGLWRLT